jgi:hypothetical protein
MATVRKFIIYGAWRHLFAVPVGTRAAENATWRKQTTPREVEGCRDDISAKAKPVIC